jgi:hypothetical protein
MRPLAPIPPEREHEIERALVRKKPVGTGAAAVGRAG